MHSTIKKRKKKRLQKDFSQLHIHYPSFIIVIIFGHTITFTERPPTSNTDLTPPILVNIPGRNHSGELSAFDDYNECNSYPTTCLNGVCVNTVNGFECQCLAGYKIDPNSHRCQGRGYILHRAGIAHTYPM